MQQNARVYSYLRFSDPRQAAGSSAARQLDYAARWAAERQLILDSNLTLRDEGLSAYHQKHVKQGALGTFLLAIEEGRIAPGSVLIVEGLDRLSRAEPIQAQAQLAQIVNAGITVVTASDGREYNRESLKAQPMDLVYSLLVMIRAHEESDTKSKRVKAAIRRQCEQWVAGTYRGIIQNGKDPQWLRHDGTGWQLMPERVDAVRTVISQFLQGYGAVKIARDLVAAGIKLTDSGASSSYIYRLVRLPALIGTKSLAIDGEEFELKEYYPPIITETEFAELQLIVGKRAGMKVKGEIPGIVAGLGITYCGYCGQSMGGHNLMNRKKREDGLPFPGHRRLMCVGYSHNNQGGCPVPGSCSVVPVENAIMAFCSDQMNLASLVEGGGDRGGPLRAKLATLANRRLTIERQLIKVTDALLAAADGATPLAFIRRARELEEQSSALGVEITSVERDLARASIFNNGSQADAWAALAEKAKHLDYDARMKVRKLVNDTFERIVIYHKSTDPTADTVDYIDLLLLAKTGTARMLRVNRKTGDFSFAEDIRNE